MMGHMESGTRDVAIVGGGAAGLSAALVLGRARRDVVVVDAGTPRNAPAAHMQGFLSRDGMPPSALLEAGRAEIERYGVEIVDDHVVEAQPGITLRLAGGRTISTRQLLLATGAEDELPDIPGVRERWGRDFLHCPYCHGWEVRDQPLGVLSTGSGSIDYAHLVREWTRDLVFFTHVHPISDRERGTLHAREIAVVDGEVERLLVNGDRLRGVQLADGRSIARVAVFIRPALRAHRDGLASGLGCTTLPGGLIRTDGEGRTTVPGVWAAGNVANPRAQVITAAGEGSTVAIAINTELVGDDLDIALR